ncbi:hypothetical protein RM550_04390 [Streptomyces sp. DSM 41527]|uniref:Uncharacterized protein n=1 Tax=Streptomyces mooreae TaxID=3075523 RepID=A0ABU2T1V7_9ACTN|nr:hypothetical protein [Streptomyces sp. DSM 41527]MDT0454983.1 hypothetical protein [Streptomyces sp. DSM 41527]
MPDDRELRPRPIAEWRDAFEFVEQVRLRPGMWVRGGSLEELSTMLFGYSVALRVHGVDEEFAFHPSSGPFASWLSREYGLPMALGWASAIERHLPDEPPLDTFFRLFDEFRQHMTDRVTGAEGTF